MKGTQKPVTWIENWKPAKIAGLDSPCHECNSHKPTTGGYIQIMRDKKRINLHRFLYIQRTGIDLPASLVVRHKCDNRRCINQEHLIPGTQKQNVRDCLDRGRFDVRLGERNYRSVLTEDLVREIRASAENHTEIAKRLNVSIGCIHGVRYGITWKTV